MPSASTLRYGKAVIELGLTGDSNIDKALRKIESRMRAFGGVLKSIGQRGLVLSAALSAPLLASIKAASDAQETLSRFRQVFGEQTAAAEQFAESLAKAVGRAPTEIKGALAAYQSFFVGLGFGSEQARMFSQQLEQLSIDFASFNNMSDAEAQQRFISALSGSSEVVDMFGINIKVAAIEQELLAMGIKKTAVEATEQEKAIARLRIIMQSMTRQGAVGDAVRTADSFANTQKRLQAELSTTAERIGNALIPAATLFLSKLANIVDSIGKWIAVAPQLVELVGGITVALGLASAAALGLGVALTALVAHPIIAGLTLLTTAVGALALSLIDVKTAAEDSFKALNRLARVFGAGIDPKVIASFDKLQKAFNPLGISKGTSPMAPAPAAAMQLPQAPAVKASAEKQFGVFRDAFDKVVSTVMVKAQAKAMRFQFDRQREIGIIGEAWQWIEKKVKEGKELAGQTADIPRQQAIFDARLASQMFGGSTVEQNIAKIARNTDPRNQRKEQAGIPVT